MIAVCVLLAVAGAAGAWLLWLKLAPRSTPAGQPALSRLDAASLQTLRDAFNAAAGQTRVLVLLSPT